MARTPKVEVERVATSLAPQKAIELFTAQIAKIDDLLQRRYNDPVVERWYNFTEQLLVGAFGKPHDNLSTFHVKRYPGGVVMMDEDGIQETYIEGLHAMKELLAGFIDQLQLLSPQAPATSEPTAPTTNDVFIVHGHDQQARAELALILTRMGLNPIILHEQPNRGLTVIEKLEKHSGVSYAFIILTPDDMGHPKDAPDATRQRARQNVVFEFGWFAGRLGRSRVCCLYKGDVELPSDLHGIAYHSFTESITELTGDIARELRAAGYELCT